MVSALMITGKSPDHRNLAWVAIQCFLKQTYQYRELIIVNDAPDAPWFGVSPHFTEVVTTPGAKLGHLRNLSLETASGDFMIQWDDDDYHHPHRIQLQMENHKPGYATMLLRQYRLNLLTGASAIAGSYGHMNGGIEGTILHERSEHRYNAGAESGEDTSYAMKWWPKINPVDNDPEIYVRNYHGGNTWDEKHVMERSLLPGEIDHTYLEGVLDAYT